MKTIAILESGKDFTSMFNANNLEIGNEVLIKSQAASGWARVGKVVRKTKTQLEVECINVIPTKDKFRWGIKNPFVDNRKNGGFFKNWAFTKKRNIGKKHKFFIESGLGVGWTGHWNPIMLANYKS